MTDPLHSTIDALMRARKIDVLLIDGNSVGHPAFFRLARGAKLEHATLIWKRGGRKLLVGIDFERDNAARTGFEFLPVSRTQAGRLRKQYAGDPVGYRVAYLLSLLRKVRAKGRLALYGAATLETTLPWLQRFRREAKRAGLELVEERSPLLDRAREIKTEDEIERIRRVGQGTCAAFDAIRRRIARCGLRGRTLVEPGGAPLTIGGLKTTMRETFMRHGLAEEAACIVAQGEEAGVPHNEGSDERKVVAGQPIVIDIFPRENPYGYFFDMTRTFCPGRAPAALKRLHQDVAEALTVGYEAFEPGLDAHELHLRVARFLEEKGYETLRSHPGTQVGFCHSLGHGVGLEVHEEPFMRATGPKELEPGMVLTLEPGLYYPEKRLGVRLEDTVVVREGALERLVDYPLTLEVPLRGGVD